MSDNEQDNLTGPDVVHDANTSQKDTIDRDLLDAVANAAIEGDGDTIRRAVNSYERLLGATDPRRLGADGDSLVPEPFQLCTNAGGKVIVIVDHDGTASKPDALPLEAVTPADGYIEIVKKLIADGHKVVINSARGIDALAKAFAGIDVDFIYNDGMAIRLNGNRNFEYAPKPAWEGIMECLRRALEGIEGVTLLEQGYNVFGYIEGNHKNYSYVRDAFAIELGRLDNNTRCQFQTEAYPNGIVIELAKKIGKKKGIQNYLEQIAKDYGCQSANELWKGRFGCIVYADDSPSGTVVAAQEYVKNFEVDGKLIGYSYLVSRNGTVPHETPPYVNQVVANETEMVAIFKQYADYIPKAAQ